MRVLRQENEQLDLKIKRETAVNDKQKKLIDERLSGLDSELSLRREILKVQEKINAQQLKQQDLGQSFLTRMDELSIKSQDFGKVWGTQFADNFYTMTEGVQGQTTFAVESLIKNFRKIDDIDVGSNLGANFAELFGGILAAASVTFGKMAIGYFAAGNIPGGIGLSAASIGAAAAAGTIGGLSSINDVQPDSSGGAARSPSTTFSVNKPTERQREQQPMVQNVFVAPWMWGESKQDTVRKIDKFNQRNRGRDQMGGRR